MQPAFVLPLVFLSVNAFALIENEDDLPNTTTINTAIFEVPNQEGDIDPWKTLTLTGYEAKVIDTSLPLWLPIAGGAAVLGAGALILAQDDDPSNPLPPVEDSCNAFFTVTTSPAICELPIGSAVLHGPPDTGVTINWYNGETTDSISNLPPGNIFVAINYADGQCLDTLYAIIPEALHDFDLSASTLKPSCTTSGDMAISYDPLSAASASITILGPNESTTIPNPPSAFLLSDFIVPVSGLYNIGIGFDESKACASSTETSLEIISLPAFTIADIIQPSGPSSSDGAIFLDITVGVLPWTLYVNEEPTQIGEDTFAVIEGLSEGTYTLELADGRGCRTPPETISLIAGGYPERPPRFSFHFIIKPLEFERLGN